MESSKTLCPVCKRPGHAFMLNPERLSALSNALLPGGNIRDDADMTAWWCLSCLTPYLVVYPDVESVDAALRMAGFPPKGGVL